MPPTYTNTYNQLFTSTLAARSAKVWEQAMQTTPLWMQLWEKNRVEKQIGGESIQEPLAYEQNDTAQFIGRGGNVVLSHTDFLTMSRYEWKYLTAHIQRYFADEQKNRGKHQVINLVTAQIDNMVKSCYQLLETKLFADGSGQDMNGLGNLVPDLPTTGTVGNIDRATYNWWRNNYEDFTSYQLAIHLLDRMDNMWNTCGIYGIGVDRMPTLTITTQAIYQAYVQEARAMGNVVMNANQNMVDLGFGDMAYNGRPFTWSPSATAEKVFMLNTNSLKIKYDPIEMLTVKEWVPMENSPRDKVGHVILVLNLLTSCARQQGVLHDVN